MTTPRRPLRLGIAGLGLIGASMALALRDGREVLGFDISPDVRRAAARRGIATVERLEDLFPADVVIVATPVAVIVPTLEALAPLATRTVLVEVGSIKAHVAEYAKRAPENVRIVGLHPMAGSTASGPDAADPALFNGRPFLVVPTARSDDRTIEFVCFDLVRPLGGDPTVCSAEDHDRAVATVSSLPLASAMALARVAKAASPIGLAEVAGPGLRDATRLAGTSAELALALLTAPGLQAHIAALRAALLEIERALGDDAALRALLERAAKDRPS